MKFAIMVRNNGRWGYSTYCERNGKIEMYDTKLKAQEVANRYNEDEGPINKFNHYFVTEWIEEDDYYGEDCEVHSVTKRNTPNWLFK